MSTFDFTNNNPFENFEIILSEAQKLGLPEYNAMNLATVDKDHKPSTRVVLFKGIVDGCFSFYTNYLGKKGRDMESNPNVGANFFWPQLERQIRIEGRVEKMSRELSETYFKSRPRVSQIGAWASNQSEEIASFEFLQNKIMLLEEKYKDQEVPCPPHWGGFLLKPELIEFWFGRVGRLHERYVYQYNQDQHNQSSEWRRSFKSP